MGAGHRTAVNSHQGSAIAVGSCYNVTHPTTTQAIAHGQDCSGFASCCASSWCQVRGRCQLQTGTYVQTSHSGKQNKLPKVIQTFQPRVTACPLSPHPATMCTHIYFLTSPGFHSRKNILRYDPRPRTSRTDNQNSPLLINLKVGMNSIQLCCCTPVITAGDQGRRTTSSRPA